MYVYYGKRMLMYIYLPYILQSYLMYMNFPYIFMKDLVVVETAIFISGENNSLYM